MTRVAIAAVVAVAVLLDAGAARANHSEDEHLTDEMPYTLRPGEWRVGLWKIEHTLSGPAWLERVQLGSYTWPWLLWSTGGSFVDLHGKVRVVDQGPWAATAGAGLLRFDFDAGDGGATFRVVPLEASVGYRVGPSLTVAAGLLYTHVQLSGNYDSDDDDFLRGAAATSNLQVPITFEWRWTRRTALVVQPRFIPYQDVGAAVHGHARLDDYTTVEVVGTGDSDVADPASAFALTTDLAFSFSHVNLRLGLTYGNFSLPVVNFVSPVKLVWPNFDLYVRF